MVDTLWKVYPYRKGSKSAKALSVGLGGRVLKLVGGKWRGRANKPSVLINWGSSSLPVEKFNTNLLNHPSCVKIAANKLYAFRGLKEAYVPIPAFTTCREEAEEMLLKSEKGVVCRTTLTGHSGEGIVIAEKIEDMVEAPLYTAYIPKRDEFRVHVFQGEAFFIQRKARSREVPDENVNWKVRNHQNGFIYSHKDVVLPEGGDDIAIHAVRALGLDFGAVDLLYGVDRKLYVLEVNTACGLEGTTLKKYVEVFKNYVQ